MFLHHSLAHVNLVTTLVLMPAPYERAQTPESDVQALGSMSIPVLYEKVQAPGSSEQLITLHMS